MWVLERRTRLVSLMMLRRSTSRSGNDSKVAIALPPSLTLPPSLRPQSGRNCSFASFSVPHAAVASGAGEKRRIAPSLLHLAPDPLSVFLLHKCFLRLTAETTPSPPQTSPTSALTPEAFTTTSTPLALSRFKRRQKEKHHPACNQALENRAHTRQAHTHAKHSHMATTHLEHTHVEELQTDYSLVCATQHRPDRQPCWAARARGQGHLAVGRWL